MDEDVREKGGRRREGRRGRRERTGDVMKKVEEIELRLEGYGGEGEKEKTRRKVKGSV